MPSRHAHLLSYAENWLKCLCINTSGYLDTCLGTWVLVGMSARWRGLFNDCDAIDALFHVGMCNLTLLNLEDVDYLSR